MASLGRVIAPDLSGHGDSGKLPVSAGPGRDTLEHTYDLLAAHLAAHFAALGADQRGRLVLHDRGSAPAFYWARLHPQQVRGVAYMEAFVMSLPT